MLLLNVKEHDWFAVYLNPCNKRVVIMSPAHFIEVLLVYGPVLSSHPYNVRWLFCYLRISSLLLKVKGKKNKPKNPKP